MIWDIKNSRHYRETAPKKSMIAPAGRKTRIKRLFVKALLLPTTWSKWNNCSRDNAEGKEWEWWRESLPALTHPKISKLRLKWEDSSDTEPQPNSRSQRGSRHSPSASSIPMFYLPVDLWSCRLSRLPLLIPWKVSSPYHALTPCLSLQVRTQQVGLERYIRYPPTVRERSTKDPHRHTTCVDVITTFSERLHSFSFWKGEIGREEYEREKIQKKRETNPHQFKSVSKALRWWSSWWRPSSSLRFSILTKSLHHHQASPPSSGSLFSSPSITGGKNFRWPPLDIQ